MTVVPHYVVALITANLNPLLLWFSNLVYTELLKRDPDHFLVKLHQQLDLSALETACADYHHASGPGAPPTHSVPRLVRALLVGCLFDWSLRQLEFQVRFNLLVKWFVGYPVYDPGPDHSTLERFLLWVDAHQHRTFFDEVLRQIDAQYPGEHRQPQVGDTFAMQANAAKEPLVRLLRHTAQRLLCGLKKIDADLHARVTAQLDLVALLGAAGEPSEYRLDEAGRAARLQATVLAALRCIQVVRQALHGCPNLPKSDLDRVEAWCCHLEKVISDEVALSPDAEGQAPRVTPLPADRRGSYRLGSATDPEATYRVHGEDKVDLGYNVSVAVSSHFVREISAATGAQPDAVGVPGLLTAQSQQHGFVPPKLIYDAAAGTGKSLGAVQQASGGQTQLVAPLIPYDQRTQRFGPDDFSLFQDGRTLRCPGGQTSQIAYRSGSGDGLVFRFFAPQCQGCPLFARCRDPKADPQSMRQVFISDYRPLLERARAYARTDNYKADMKRRPLVERFIAALTRYHGARRARRAGTDHADFQARLSATALNLKQWMALLPPMRLAS
jgi:transposase